MIEKNLSKLGFSPSEIKIYLHLLKTGRSYANRISSETKINRSNVYEALDRLISKGVISYIVKNKVKWYEARNPESIKFFIKEKEDELENTKSDVFLDIDNLKKLIPKNVSSLEANVFVGKKGLRMLFEEILEVKKNISIIAASKLQLRSLFGPYFFLWHKKRIEKRIYQRSIFPKSVKKNVENFKFKYFKYKFIDDKFKSPTTTIIYGDNCLFIQWLKDPIAIKIKNKEIAKSHLNYFNMLWNS